MDRLRSMNDNVMPQGDTLVAACDKHLTPMGGVTLWCHIPGLTARKVGTKFGPKIKFGAYT